MTSDLVAADPLVVCWDPAAINSAIRAGSVTGIELEEESDAGSESEKSYKIPMTKQKKLTKTLPEGEVQGPKFGVGSRPSSEVIRINSKLKIVRIPIRNSGSFVQSGARNFGLAMTQGICWHFDYPESIGMGRGKGPRSH